MTNICVLNETASDDCVGSLFPGVPGIQPDRVAAGEAAVFVAAAVMMVIGALASLVSAGRYATATDQMYHLK